MKHALILATGLMASLPASANVQPAADDAIVVTGSLAEARKQARSYIRQLGIASGEQQAARWFTPVCPRALGIGKQQAAWVEDRIRTVTRQAGAPLAPVACKANLLVIFTKDADAMVRHFGSSPPGRLGHPGNTAVRRLKSEQAPVRWFYNVSTQSYLGEPETSDAPKGAAFTEPGSNRQVDPPGGPSTTLLHHYAASLVSTRAARSIYAATVIVDVNRTKSAKLGSLADYAALVGLAEVNLGAAPDNSVLSLFKAEDGRFITERDRLFLGGLYRITMDREAHLQRRMLINEITRPAKATVEN